MIAVHVVVPAGIDDPAHPSGGNAYDRQICRGLATMGWSVHEHPAAGCWPAPDAASRASLARLIAAIPDRAVVLVDGLIASTVPDVLVPQAHRLRLVVLVHMPLGAGPVGDQQPWHEPLGAQPLPNRPWGIGSPDDQPPYDEVAHVRARECAVLSAAVAIVTTSAWTRRRLLEWYGLGPEQVHVAEPGVDAADLATGTATGGELLCVGAVTPVKGHDVLLAALADVTDLPWHCVCVGSLNRDPRFVRRICHQALLTGMGARVSFPGPRSAKDLDNAYAAADGLVLASRAETYGMVVTEALARGLPVVATAVGGVPEALGRGAGGSRPGMLVAPGDPAALAEALRWWLVDAGLRRRLRRVARERRLSLPSWSATTNRISRVLTEAAA